MAEGQEKLFDIQKMCSSAICKKMLQVSDTKISFNFSKVRFPRLRMKSAFSFLNGERFYSFFLSKENRRSVILNICQ